ncbi:carboxylesterase [Novosphingobium umbonatum]|uniref:Carboxylic ester hydrolase n=2 Tax=Novosphingobium umbonatum TaxID=1908524 RepID=A0A437NDF4_9SPHN|nr:carboxylesterase [Novosphingobium umbonatum]
MSFSIAAPALAGPVVHTGLGRVEGVAKGKVEAFLGLPYAQAPEGELRWRAPVPVKAWQGIRDAGKSGPACYQADGGAGWGPYSAEFIAPTPFAEDCLTLNVWRPAGAGKGLPVLVFIHGGGFGGGGANVPIYDGAALAQRGVVVVTIQYRVGVFGFAAHPVLSAESPRHVSGNYGLLDQIEALKWVRAHVGSFGGDAANITLAGESAGAASVGDLLVSPLAKGLFAKAFALSGASMAVDTPPLVKAEQVGVELWARLGKQSAAEMRAMPADALVEATKAIPDASGKGPGLVYVPNVDGAVLPHDPTLVGKPVVNRVPLMSGFNGAEMIDPSVDTPERFEQALKGRYGSFADRLLALYPHATPEEVRASNLLVARDRYMSGLLLWAEARKAASGQPVYAYLYDHAYPAKPGGVGFGAFHSSQLPYIFGNLGLGGRSFSAQDQRISRQWQDLLLAYMRKGNPSGVNGVWQPVGRADDLRAMQIGDRKGMGVVVSSPERFAAFKAYAKAGGNLGLM